MIEEMEILGLIGAGLKNILEFGVRGQGRRYMISFLRRMRLMEKV